jgi:hypothetical protein
MPHAKAADRGNCIAMMNIGGVYVDGSHGMTQDASRAERQTLRPRPAGSLRGYSARSAITGSTAAALRAGR